GKPVTPSMQLIDGLLTFHRTSAPYFSSPTLSALSSGSNLPPIGVSVSGPAFHTTGGLVVVTFTSGSPATVVAGVQVVTVPLSVQVTVDVALFHVPLTKSGGVPVPPTICQSPLVVWASVMSVQNIAGRTGRFAGSQPPGQVSAPVVSAIGPPAAGAFGLNGIAR